MLTRGHRTHLEPSRPEEYREAVHRRGAGVLAAAAFLACGVTAFAATRADWSVDVSRPTGTLRVAKAFAVVVAVAPTDGTTDSYNSTLTLTPSTTALRIVSWSSAAGIRCTRSGKAVQCTQRSIGGEAPFNELSAAIVLRATKAGKHSLSAKLTIEGDTESTNNVARRTFTVKPAPKMR
jgi:hypothetical protein